MVRQTMLENKDSVETVLGANRFTYEIIKKSFEQEVNSVRRFEEIKNSEELFNVLDVRGILVDHLLETKERNFQKCKKLFALQRPLLPKGNLIMLKNIQKDF